MYKMWISKLSLNQFSQSPRTIFFFKEMGQIGAERIAQRVKHEPSRGGCFGPGISAFMRILSQHRRYLIPCGLVATDVGEAVLVKEESSFEREGLQGPRRGWRPAGSQRQGEAG